mmetsp:Transcript_9860/g.14325  ORF Transcript_9860/g.14325 Transcript_9860/m.14325 type:complete len:87 (+) Transcript_9860:163-423(+)
MTYGNGNDRRPPGERLLVLYSPHRVGSQTISYWCMNSMEDTRFDVKASAETTLCPSQGTMSGVTYSSRVFMRDFWIMSEAAGSSRA